MTELTEVAATGGANGAPGSGAGGDLVVAFLLARRPDLGVIDPDYDLIDNRVLDSLGFVNFLYVLEEQTGREISLDQVSPEDFRTLRRIRERFFDVAAD